MAFTYDERREEARRRAAEKMGKRVREHAGTIGGKYGGREDLFEVFPDRPVKRDWPGVGGSGNELLDKYPSLKSLRENRAQAGAFIDFWEGIPEQDKQWQPGQVDSGIDLSDISGEIERRRRLYTEEIARQTQLPLHHIDSEGWDQGEMGARMPGQRYGPGRFVFGNKPDHPEGAVAFWVKPEKQEAYFAEKEQALHEIDPSWSWEKQHEAANRAFSRLREKYFNYITEKDLSLYGINEE